MLCTGEIRSGDPFFHMPSVIIMGRDRPAETIAKPKRMCLKGAGVNIQRRNMHGSYRVQLKFTVSRSQSYPKLLVLPQV